MAVLTDIEIAQNAEIKKITSVAGGYGINEDELELYGNFKAKIEEGCIKRLEEKENGKLILVTAINPTPAGEGKTTTTIGLTDALNRIGKKTAAALREPSLGPCFGVKGGAAGGGYAQVIPMEDLNLHFTGDFHAITSANNLLAAMIDNHIHHGNELKIDTESITWKRSLDMNDRVLRDIVVGLGPKSNGVVREDGFIITVASEIMAVFCLAQDITDLRERLEKIIVAYDVNGRPVTAKQLDAVGAMVALLKDAFKPNIVQTLEGNLAFVHGGPFANIAHGCNSVRATRLALKTADYAVTEAGFGADLGAEKFMDIKCRLTGIRPDAVVIVATIRALKYNGGVDIKELNNPDVEALKKGFENLKKHIENVKSYGVPAVVAINAFASDTEEEYAFLREAIKELGCRMEVSEVWGKGGEGGIDLARAVVDIAEGEKEEFHFAYPLDMTIKEKLEKLSKDIYGADGVEYSLKAEKEIERLEKMGFGSLPVCVAKTQYSLSDNPKLLGRPEGFHTNVRDVYVSAGAGFIVALMGNILTMPGLPSEPAAKNIKYDEKTGKISGLF